MKKILLTLLMFPLLVSAQAGELVLGEMTVEYETVVEKDSSTLYFVGDEMVVSDHGDLWVVYKDGEDILEAYDTTHDGEPDTFITLSSTGEVMGVTGFGADRFTIPEVVEFDELLSEMEEGGSEASTLEDEDLVGSLGSIKIPKYHNYGFYAFTIIFITAAYWWYRRKNGDEN